MKSGEAALKFCQHVVHHRDGDRSPKVNFRLLSWDVVTMLLMTTAVRHGWSTDGLTDARSYMLNITSTDFIATLVITKNSLGYTKALTINLQAEAIDIVAAASQINTVTSTLQDVRDNIDTYQSECYIHCITLLNSLSAKLLHS